MLLKSVRNCDRTPLLLTQQQPTNTTAEDRGGRCKKTPNWPYLVEERGAKKGGRREWTWVAFQWAERDEVEMEEGRGGEAKRGRASLPPSHEPWQSGVKAAE